MADGVVGMLPFRVGALVSPAMPKALTTVSDNSSMYVYFSMYVQEGRIETISGVIDPATGTVSLRAVFPNSDGLLSSGGSGSVVLSSERADCIVIPQTATYEVQDQVYVYKVEDGKAVSALVEVTRVNGGQEYIVEEGLQSGDVIVTEGVGLLREGTPIQVKE